MSRVTIVIALFDSPVEKSYNANIMSFLAQIGLASDLMSFVAMVGGGLVVILASLLKAATKKALYLPGSI